MLPFATPSKRQLFNKQRLYVALYRPQPNPPNASALKLAIPASENPNERAYRWRFLIGPKKEQMITPGISIEVCRDDDGDWYLHRRYEPNVRNTGDDMLVRVRIGKIKNMSRFYNTLYPLPVHPIDHAYRNKTWVLDGLDELRINWRGIMSESSKLNRHEIEALITNYVNQKVTSGRFTHPFVDNGMHVPKPL